jgi:hypothetical protein
MPDYANATTVESLAVPYTAPYDISFRFVFPTAYREYKINDKTLTWGSSGGVTEGEITMQQGDVLTGPAAFTAATIIPLLPALQASSLRVPMIIYLGRAAQV